jgi:hypothetical protein
LDIDYKIILLTAELPEQTIKVPELVLRLIKRNYLIDFWMVIKEGFIPFPDQKIDACIRIMVIDFFNEAGRQYHIPEESGLDNQDIFQAFFPHNSQS